MQLFFKLNPATIRHNGEKIQLLMFVCKQTDEAWWWIRSEIIGESEILCVLVTAATAAAGDYQ